MNFIGKKSNFHSVHLFLPISCLFLIIGIFSSWNLWFGSRHFPMLPFIVDFHWPVVFNEVLTGAMLLFLLVSVVFHRRVLVCGIFVVLATLLLQDQMRWQPWVYCYSLFIIPFLLRRKPPQTYFILVLSAVYFWSGFHKLNAGFNDFIFVKIMEQAFGLYLKKYAWAGNFFAVTELLIGLGILFRYIRKIACIAGIGGHLFLLFWLVLIWQNTVIIPWNIAMILYLLLAFKTSKNIRWKEFYRVSILSILSISIYLLPILSIWGMWDQYFSFVLYSGKGQYLRAKLPLKDNPLKPYEVIEPYLTEGKNGRVMLSFHAWAMDELNVPVPSEMRVFRILGNQFCAKYVSPEYFIIKSEAGEEIKNPSFCSGKEK